MPDFAYIGKDRSGRTVQGVVQAENSALAVGRARELGVEVERVRPVGPSRSEVGLMRRIAENVVLPVVSGVPLKALAVFFRQLATLINAGIPLYQALTTLEHQTKNARLQAILRDGQRHVLEGGRLSEVMERANWVFSPMQIEMVRAAEQGGMLDQMLSRIADYLDQELELRRLISRLTLYPKITLFVALMVLGKSCFLDMKTMFVPAVARLVLGGMGKDQYTAIDYFWDTLGFLGIAALCVFAVVAVCRVTLFQSEAAREGLERVKQAIPGVGTVSRHFALAKFGRAFSALYAGGLPLSTAIAVAGEASGSSILRHATGRAVRASERGASLSQAFRETGAFPPMVLDMLQTGEQTGNLDAMMNKAAEYLEGEAEARAHMYSNIFAVAVALIVAMLVGFAIIRFYMGMASNLSNAVGGAGD